MPGRKPGTLRLRAIPVPDQRSGAAQSYRHWYWRKPWLTRSRAHLAREPLCCMCLEQGLRKPAVVADHIVPHRGDYELFRSGALQSLCASHHSKAKQQEERRGFSSAIGSDGYPLDPQHPANGGKPVKQLGLGPISHPVWFRPVRIPLTIVCRPPAAGKTTWVTAHAAPGDVVLDLDAIAMDLYRRPLPQLDRDAWFTCLKHRNEVLGQYMRARPDKVGTKAWLIVAEPEAQKRQWWMDTTRPQAIVVIETPAALCRERAKAPAVHRAPDVGKRIDEWWAAYKPRAGDVVVRPGD